MKIKRLPRKTKKELQRKFKTLSLGNFHYTGSGAGDLFLDDLEKRTKFIISGRSNNSYYYECNRKNFLNKITNMDEKYFYRYFNNTTVLGKLGLLSICILYTSWDTKSEKVLRKISRSDENVQAYVKTVHNIINVTHPKTSPLTYEKVTKYLSKYLKKSTK